LCGGALGEKVKERKVRGRRTHGLEYRRSITAAFVALCEFADLDHRGLFELPRRNGRHEIAAFAECPGEIVDAHESGGGEERSAHLSHVGTVGPDGVHVHMGTYVGELDEGCTGCRGEADDVGVGDRGDNIGAHGHLEIWEAPADLDTEPLGGLGVLAPSRKSDVARLGFYALLGGSLASFMTGCIAGMLVP